MKRSFSSTWFRWGRVGLKGRSELKSHFDLGDAKQYFMNKFYDKTLNDWTVYYDLFSKFLILFNFKERDAFVPYPNKYTLIKVKIEKKTFWKNRNRLLGKFTQFSIFTNAVLHT